MKSRILQLELCDLKFESPKSVNCFLASWSDSVELEINFKKETQLKLQILDINGKEIKEEEFSGNGKIITKINTSLFVSGVYVFSIYNKQKLLGSSKVVIEH